MDYSNLEKADYDVYKTSDYTIFSFMEDNRVVNADIVRKIKEKIQEFGWIREPILVNEKLQIIDGQHRFTALKELGFPVEFIIDEGIGVKECRAINEDNGTHGARLVIIQSQLGNPICVYSGNDVSWDIPKNLPKTTMVTIDGKVLYIHRANFSIVDMELID